jgi:hypothetical protein
MWRYFHGRISGCGLDAVEVNGQFEETPGNSPRAADAWIEWPGGHPAHEFAQGNVYRLELGRQRCCNAVVTASNVVRTRRPDSVWVVDLRII